MKVLIIAGLILSITFFYTECYSQVTRHKKEIESIHGFFALQAGVPSNGMQEAIKNKMGNLGIGGGLCALFNPFTWGKNKRNSPLRIGAEADYTYYGRFLTEVDVNGNKGDFKTSYGILQLNGLLQLRPRETEFITPFLEIFGGGSFYLSSIKENLGVIESSLGIPPIEFDSYSSASFSKGAAAGFRIGKPGEEEPRFTLRISYTRGDHITYIVRNSLAYNASYNRMEYYINRAPVSYFLIQLGVGN